MHATIHIQKSWIRAALNCSRPVAGADFILLRQQKEFIEQEIGCPLDWEELPGKKESRIALRKQNIDPVCREDWPVQHQWIAEKLEAFHKAFASRVKELNAEEYEVPAEG